MLLKKYLKIIVSLFVVTSITLFADDTSLSPQELAKKLHLIPGSKAIVQWERIFKSKRKLKRYKIDTLTKEQQKKLKEYLIEHAIDSDQPTVAGV